MDHSVNIYEYPQPNVGFYFQWKAHIDCLGLQPYIEGSDIKTHFSEDDSDNDALLLFFEKALRMYTETRRIPDVANLQEYFNPLVNSNVVVTKRTDGLVTPILTDTNFGKIQRSSILGPFWSFAIAKGVSRFVEQLKERNIKD